SGKNTIAIQQSGNASAKSSSRGRIVFRQKKIAPGRIATDHGNHQITCSQRNRSDGTPLSFPGTFENERKCPSHSIWSNCWRNPGKRNSVATYHGTNSTRKIDIYPQWKSRRKRRRASR